MSETDPWAKVRTFDVSTYGDCRMERDYYGEIASEQKYQRGEYAWVDEVDAARAAEAAQHQQEIAAKDETIDGLRLVALGWEKQRDEARARLAAVEAERDQLYPTPEPETCEWRITTGPLGIWVTPFCVAGSIPAPWGTERAKSCHLCGQPLRLVPAKEQNQ